MQELPHLNMFAQPPPIVMMALSTQSPAAALGELENVAGPPHAASQVRITIYCTTLNIL